MASPERKKYSALLTYLSRDQHRKVKREASECGLSVSDYVRIRLHVQPPPPALVGYFAVKPDPAK